MRHWGPPIKGPRPPPQAGPVALGGPAPSSGRAGRPLTAPDAYRRPLSAARVAPILSGPGGVSERPFKGPASPPALGAFCWGGDRDGRVARRRRTSSLATIWLVKATATWGAAGGLSGVSVLEIRWILNVPLGSLIFLPPPPPFPHILFSLFFFVFKYTLWMLMIGYVEPSSTYMHIL